MNRHISNRLEQYLQDSTGRLHSGEQPYFKNVILFPDRMDTLSTIFRKSVSEIKKDYPDFSEAEQLQIAHQYTLLSSFTKLLGKIARSTDAQVSETATSFFKNPYLPVSEKRQLQKYLELHLDKKLLAEVGGNFIDNDVSNLRNQLTGFIYELRKHYAPPERHK